MANTSHPQNIPSNFSLPTKRDIYSKYENSEHMDKRENLEIHFKNIFNLIYRDRFTQAYENLDSLSLEVIHKQDMKLDYTPKNGWDRSDERIFNLMKLVKYCQENLDDSQIQRLASGEDKYQFWYKQWILFENFIKTQMIYFQANYLGMKNYFYQKMIDNLILEFNSQSYYKPIMLETCKKLLEIGSWEKAEEGLNYLMKNSPKLLPDIKLQLVELYYYQNKKTLSLQILKDLLFSHPKINISELPIPEIKNLVRELFIDGLSLKEIQIWIGVFLMIRKILPIFYSLNNEEYKQAVILLNQWEKTDHQDEVSYNAILVYRYLYVIDQFYTRIIKGKTYLQKDMDHYLTKLKQVNNYIYQQVKDTYGT